MPQSVVDKFVYSNTYNTFFNNVRKIFEKRHAEHSGSTKETPQKSREEEIDSHRFCDD